MKGSRRGAPRTGPRPPEPTEPHPSLDIVESDGVELSGRRIILCIAGSVAVYKAIELARLLMRHGADVVCVASGAATRLVRPDYFRWATGNAVITKLTGELEHIRLADYGRSDMIIVYPCTANTLGKLANGIDDTPISTVLTVGFGARIPIVISPAMHSSMYDNPAVKKNMEFLRGRVGFVGPQIVEGKAKAAEPEDVLGYVLRRFGFSPGMAGRRVLISAGPTVEHIDPVRAITNLSSGRTGVLLAAEFLAAGARVTLVYGPGTARPPGAARTIRVGTTQEMEAAIRGELARRRYDIVIMAAAAADYAPATRRKTKIKSGGDERISIVLKRTPKILDRIKRMQKDVFLVGFKAETNVSKKELERRGRARLAASGADLIIANDVGDPRYRRNPAYNEVLIIDGEGTRSSGRRRKERIAKIIKKEIESRVAA